MNFGILVVDKFFIRLIEIITLPVYRWFKTAN